MLIKVIEGILAFFIGFCLGYILISFLEEASVAQNTPRCAYNSEYIGGTAMQKGWYCK